ncbi:hypothetical protein ACTXT7_014133 [Hymenolepis weldensis]
MQIEKNLVVHDHLNPKSIIDEAFKLIGTSSRFHSETPSIEPQVKLMQSNLGCTIFSKWADQVSEFKFHDSSPRLQQMLVYDIRCLLTGRVGIAASLHFFLMVEKEYIVSPIFSQNFDARLTISLMSDAEILRMVREGQLKTRELETAVKSLPRAVSLRRQDLASRLSNPQSVNSIPYTNYDYRSVMGQCCEESTIKIGVLHTTNSNNSQAHLGKRISKLILVGEWHQRAFLLAIPLTECSPMTIGQRTSDMADKHGDQCTTDAHYRARVCEANNRKTSAPVRKEDQKPETTPIKRKLVIGYIPIPLGKVGPLLLDGKEHYVPMATTEGCLVASTNRGCRALFLSGGVKTALFRLKATGNWALEGLHRCAGGTVVPSKMDQMTRAPVVFFPSVAEVVKCIAWIESPEGFQILRKAFNETSSHADLISVFPNPAGRYLHLRFAARTGEAMGMNMVSKGTERAIRCLNNYFPRMQLISLSGNMCSDKKPAAINHVMGRGKSVLAEARIPGRVVAKVLRTDAKQLSRLTQIKIGTGSAMAGSLGMAGANAHAANLVAAVFAATGQDLAQIIWLLMGRHHHRVRSRHGGVSRHSTGWLVPCFTNRVLLHRNEKSISSNDWLNLLQYTSKKPQKEEMAFWGVIKSPSPTSVNFHCRLNKGRIETLPPEISFFYLQVVDSSACMTQLEAEPDGSLYVSVTMPCIEVGTVGGGTRLQAQRGCLEMLDLQVERPAEHLARLIAGMVLAGEISLLAALATNDLVQAHMRLNRAAAAVAVATAGNPTTEKAGAVENGDVHTASSRNVEHFAM